MARYRIAAPFGPWRFSVRGSTNEGEMGTQVKYPAYVQDVFGGQAAASYTDRGYISEMWDTVESRRSSRSYPFHNCVQYKYRNSTLTNKRSVYFLNNPEVPTYYATEQSPCYKLIGGYWGGLPSSYDIPGMLTDLASKLNGCISHQTLLPVSIIELGKTVRMIKNPFGLLKTDWRKIAGSSPARTLSRRAANVWLEGNYGWGAFYSDLKSIRATGQDLLGTPSSNLSAAMSSRFGVSRRYTSGMTEWGYSYGGNPAWFAQDYTGVPYTNNGQARCRQISAEASCTIGCYQINNLAQRMSNTQRTLRAWGADSGSILDVLWELTPFSFVVDWFVDMKGLWSLPYNLWRLNSADVRDLHYTVKRTAYGEVQAVVGASYPLMDPWCNHPDASPTSQSGQLGTATPSFTEYNRVLGLPSFPTLVNALNGQGLSATRTLSGIALGIQKLLR